MLRQLLTLLAVISGFTLAAEPVSAADASLISIAAAEQADCIAVVSTPVQLRQKSPVGDVPQAWPCATEPAIEPVPSVRIQVDRARE
ncbi:hypothetical protein AAV99_13390 [Aurantiacibacter marinus]|uniref:Uncharacterized protein n=2 Tax=Aurantiacibacter marinus TaxID=874156 RepID=A0A0H0XL84_9SPHN|nr:hypothetical protein AAV99_13390 [Aurantiacibacter marinus]